MTQLLDVNLLVALAWPNHVHHEAAHRWFSEVGAESWATCPLTQSGFVRVSSNRRVIADACTPREALHQLGRMVALPGHVFWTDETAIVESDFVDRDRLVGYRQVTDAHLLAVALSRGGCLATFDRAIRQLVPTTFDSERAVTLLA